MNRAGARRAAAAALLACLWSSSAWGAEITAAQAVEALKRHVCFSRTWWGDPYARLGQTATVDIRIDGRNAFVWSEDMRAVPRVRRWADSYAVAARAGGAVVTERSGYNIELLRGEPGFERERRRVYGGPTQRVRIELPSSCEPRFDPDTPLKVEMREAVTRSLSAAVSTWGQRPPRSGLRVTIADFNVDYPETFALRHDTGEILRIGLQSGVGGRPFVVTPVPRGLVAAQLRRLILRHGREQALRAPLA